MYIRYKISSWQVSYKQRHREREEGKRWINVYGETRFHLSTSLFVVADATMLGTLGIAKEGKNITCSIYFGYNNNFFFFSVTLKTGSVLFNVIACRDIFHFAWAHLDLLRRRRLEAGDQSISRSFWLIKFNKFKQVQFHN